ncbi:unnamed protein product [Ostreobium quekettii]|uniref:Uncharacterized protein n=1 Tax=Ostreobium quekettii TaxID=121088 RepID=A0A8S1J5M4_9CHLO|nr:unnamed protein product [Ostreobium quekettii]|eukprot:evm.model.scf_122.2 EVM.evm.TU.scf_122.2   scf_122:2487-3672(-)
MRRELQRAAGALAIPPLKAAEGPRFPLALAAEGRRPKVAHDAPNLDIFQMEMEIGGVRSDHDATSERFTAVSDTCSEASNDTNVLNVLEDFMGRDNEFGGSFGLEPAKSTAAGRLFRNKSGHLPTARPAVGGGFMPTKPFGKLGRSRSSHQPKARCQGDQDQLKVGFEPPTGKLLQRKELTLQSWAAKCREACLQELPKGPGFKSAPVPISRQSSCKAAAASEDHGCSPFIPPHEYLSLNNDPEKVAFANPSTGRLKGLSSLRKRNRVLAETGYYEGYTEMWQQPQRFSPVAALPDLESQFDFCA